MFPCGEGSLSPVAVARTILRANETSKERPLGRFGIAPWSAHDLRRTALTGMARLGVAPIVLGHVANHRTTTRAGVTLAVYSQYTYDKEKRAGARFVGLSVDRDLRPRRCEDNAASASESESPMKLSDIRTRPGTWRYVEFLLAKGGEPTLDELLNALRGEKGIPPRSMAYISASSKATTSCRA